MNDINSIAQAIKNNSSEMNVGAEIKLEVTQADRSKVEGYVTFDEICGFKTGIDMHFKKYKVEDWDDKVRGLIPTTDDTIKVDSEFALAICMAIQGDMSLLAYGPPGTGKTVTPKEICARLNYPYLSIQGMGGTEPADYVGSPHLERDGDVAVMQWRDGIATHAVRYGAFLLFDEPFKVSAQTNMCFQSLMDDRRELKLYGHPNPIESTLKAHPNFRICLADNVRGVGDNMGKYAAEIQDQSTMDRMDLVVKVGYPKATDENKIMQKKFPDMDKDLIAKVIKVATLIRKSWASDDVELPYTMRKVQGWLKTINETGNIPMSFRLTYLNSCTGDDEVSAVTKAYTAVGFGTGNDL